MPLTRRLFLGALASAGIGSLLLALCACILAAPLFDNWREAAFDELVQVAPPVSGQVVVVEIDDASLAHFGPWPWARTRLAALLTRIADARPRAVGIDILLAGPDRYGREALGQQLGDEAHALYGALPDGDGRLTKAIGAAPTVLSALLADQATASPPQVPILLQGEPPKLVPWTSAGAVQPLEVLSSVAAGMGVGSLSGDERGVVRQVPLFALAASVPVPGLAAETLRVAEQAGSFILIGEGPSLAIGGHAIPLTPDSQLRFRPSPSSHWGERSLSAEAILDGEVPPQRLAGKIVLLGGSAPALGALRATAASPVAPSVQIEADALETILSERVPLRPSRAGWIEGAAFVLLALAGALSGASLTPLRALAVTAGSSLAWTGATIAVFRQWDWLVDSVLPPLAALVSLIAAAAHAAIVQRRQAAGIRRRFEQHLAPELVARIVERPDLVRFSGERREVTALFTDIEGFTALTERLDAERLVALLDAYFSGIADIVVRHGGMIDKFVGDAAHCLFNAPLDLPDHPRQALTAAQEIIAFSRTFAARTDVAAAGLGRTRIGLECGDAVVGDVGMGSKLDYTAHGTAVNMAARLEAINKDFGTDICIGPNAGARLADAELRALGPVELRGLGPVQVFTVAP
ncbi:CHASE2 domain-containing protein [Oryzibacter oryziterrae]|uniref:CHASE2 domain-containing protein n=1 Tax=Oryzibacter oryziterrae TaxID=2766474 RepID=UPI001F176EDE|nr:adenylate/guanylate cyclase domain-containing protein [Oryzibacter oryziterrae]